MDPREKTQAIAVATNHAEGAEKAGRCIEASSLDTLQIDQIGPQQPGLKSTCHQALAGSQERRPGQINPQRPAFLRMSLPGHVELHQAPGAAAQIEQTGLWPNSFQDPKSIPIRTGVRRAFILGDRGF
jgi:hypothetical protein